MKYLIIVNGQCVGSLSDLVLFRLDIFRHTIKWSSGCTDDVSTYFPPYLPVEAVANLSKRISGIPVFRSGLPLF